MNAPTVPGEQPADTRTPQRQRRLSLPWIAFAVLVVASLAATTLQIAISAALTDDGDLLSRPIPRPPATTGASNPQPAPSSSPSPPVANSASPDPSTVSPDRPTSPRPTVSRPSIPVTPLPVRFREMLGKFRFSVDQGVAARQIRDDVGLDLNNLIRGAFEDSGSGDPDLLRQHLAKLREKVGTRKREGAITPHRAAELQLILGQAGL
ncbi:hypothetical protein [Actinomadura sp. 6N118]|uniref:hypothetical protein n=1 Tax=Actinomadura sp. 6N118 TaxID=3375151 RepID=UPI0037B75FFC